MTENLTNEDISTTEQVTTTPAEVKIPEHMIPKSRLDEVLGKNRELESRLAAVEKNAKDNVANMLKEQGKFKELYEQTLKELAEAQPLAIQAHESERTLQMVLQAQTDELPEHLRVLVPEALSTQQKLEWLARNKTLLIKPKAFDIGAGRTGGGAPEGADLKLTEEELTIAKNFGLTPEEYVKYKDK